MKLQILIPQYKETDEIIKPLLDSIAIQQNVDFREIGVIICNDGSDVRLSEMLLKNYPFEVQYHTEPHRGVSGTRNACLDYATADYVMFCDADDMFYNACGLWIVFREIDNGGFDTMVSAFIEETRNPADGQPVYINHDMDATFVHGKIHKREYLLREHIRWNDALTIHEDSYFNCLCQKLTVDAKYCQTPFYLWRWRDDSVCRHDPLYLNRTYVNMLESNTALVKEFLKRDRVAEAKYFAANMIYDCYFSMNCDRWWEGEGVGYREKTERRIAQYYADFGALIESLDEQTKAQIIMGQKNRFFGEGLLFERVTFEEWIKNIKGMKL